MTSEPFATIEDLSTIWRPVADDAEKKRADALLQIVSDTIRCEAERVGKRIDEMVEEDHEYQSVVKSVVVDIVARMLMTSTDQEPMTQFAQAAGGYSVSGSFLVPGGGIFIKKTELARLGLRRQKVGGIDFYG